MVMAQDQTIQQFVRRYRKLASSAKLRDAEYYWHGLDAMLIAMCQKAPLHTDFVEVYGKVALVNRAYRANLHMGPNEPEKLVAEALYKKKVDGVFAPLRVLDAFNTKTLPAVVKAHASLVELAHDAVNKNVVSFCSKYLSFHFPHLVPVFDSKAVDSARKLTRDEMKAGGEWEFERHCERVAHLVSVLVADGTEKPDLKLIDFLLYG